MATVHHRLNGFDGPDVWRSVGSLTSDALLKVEVLDRFVREARRRGYSPTGPCRHLLLELWADPAFGPTFLERLRWALYDGRPDAA